MKHIQLFEQFIDEAKKYDIGSGYMGNGLTIWNRAEEEFGDYKTIAHIGNNGELKIYDKGMPGDIKKMLQIWADSMKKGNKGVIDEAKKDLIALDSIGAFIDQKKGTLHPMKTNGKPDLDPGMEVFIYDADHYEIMDQIEDEDQEIYQAMLKKFRVEKTRHQRLRNNETLKTL